MFLLSLAGWPVADVSNFSHFTVSDSSVLLETLKVFEMVGNMPKNVLTEVYREGDLCVHNDTQSGTCEDEPAGARTRDTERISHRD